MKITDERFKYAYDILKARVDSLVRPVVIKRKIFEADVDFIDLGSAVPMAIAFKFLPISGKQYLEDDEYSRYEELRLKQTIRDVRIPKFIVSLDDSVNWNIRGYNRSIIEEHNCMVQQKLELYGSTKTDHTGVKIYKQAVEGMFKEYLVNLMVEEPNREGISIKESVLPYFIYNGETLEKLLDNTITESAYMTGDRLSEHVLLKSARNFKYSVNEDGLNEELEEMFS